MNAHLEKLHQIGLKKERLILGLMSGTSFDGLDIALCKIKGHGTQTKLTLLNFETIPYSSAFKEELKSVFCRRNADLEKLCVLNAWVALEHARLVNECLQKWKVDHTEIDLLASHGQTVYHAPRFMHPDDKFPNATLQIGDGDHLAVATGILTVSDFRQKHIAAGGEGAPLAVYGDYLIFSKHGENRIMLNIGGIANFTFLPGDLDPAKVFASDVGPGNTLMDACVQNYFPGNYYDRDAALARRGKVNESLLMALKEHPFFAAEFPKTTGPELFNLVYLENAQRKSGTVSLPPEDLLATLNRFTADMIVFAIKKCIGDQSSLTIYVSGGGMHNPLLMKNIQTQLPGLPFFSTTELQVQPDAKEAVLFALLANECICGDPATFTGSEKTRGMIPVTMGKISFPR